MATQGQRRSEAKAAIRRLRAEYRKADSSGETVQRELERLLKRKTLIGPDSLQTLANRIDTYARLVESVQRLYLIVWGIIQNVPR